MEIKFDFEVDSRFNYTFDEDVKEFVIDVFRDGVALFLKQYETEIDKYNNGVVVIIVSDKIDVLREMNIPPLTTHNQEFPEHLKKLMWDALHASNLMKGLDTLKTVR